MGDPMNINAKFPVFQTLERRSEGLRHLRRELGRTHVHTHIVEETRYGTRPVYLPFCQGQVFLQPQVTAPVVYVSNRTQSQHG